MTCAGDLATPRWGAERGVHPQADSEEALLTRREQGFCVEAATGIEPVYRALQVDLGFDENGV